MSIESRRRVLKLAATGSIASLFGAPTLGARAENRRAYDPDSPIRITQAIPGATPRQSNAPIRLLASGRAYAGGVYALMEDIRECHAHRALFPIARLFDLFPFNVSDSRVVQALISRGTLQIGESEIKNSGDYVEATFVDENFGALTVPFSESVVAGLIITPQSIAFTFEGGYPVDFATVEKRYGIPRTQRLDRILITHELISYFFHAHSNPDSKTQIDVDLIGSHFASLKTLVASAGALPTMLALSCADEYNFCFGGFGCPCCGKKDTANAIPTGSPGRPLQYNAACIWTWQTSNAPAYSAYIHGTPFGNPSSNEDTVNWILGKTITFSIAGASECANAGHLISGGRAIASATFLVNWMRVEHDIVNPDGYTVLSNVVQAW